MNKLLIFDVDGVLEKEELIIKARHDALIKAIADKFKISLEEAQKKYEAAKNELPLGKKETSAYIFMKCGFSRKDYFNVLDSVEPEGIIEPHENCEELLKKIHNKNKIISYSNSPKKASIKTLKVLKIDLYIDKIYSSEDFKESKPSLNNLRKMMEETGFQPKNTILIGNSVKKDIMPAHELGIKTILFDPYNKHQDKPKEADFVIRNLIEIADIVKK